MTQRMGPNLLPLPTSPFIRRTPATSPAWRWSS